MMIRNIVFAMIVYVQQNILSTCILLLKWKLKEMHTENKVRYFLKDTTLMKDYGNTNCKLYPTRKSAGFIKDNGINNN
jgi:hypothetical protein